MHGSIINGVYYKREREAGKLRLGSGSWSIPVQAIMDPTVETVVYYTETTMYRISKKTALEKGFDKNLGGEDKLCVELKWWYTEPLQDLDQEAINRAHAL